LKKRLGTGFVIITSAALYLTLAMHGTVPQQTPHKVRRVSHHSTRSNARLRRIVWTPLRGSHESLLRQNLRTSEDELDRIQDSAQLEELTAKQDLVNLPVDHYAVVSPKIPAERRYCRPWTRSFIEDFGRDFYDQFKQPVQATSAVRTVEVQHKLRRHNGNAAPDTGEVASPHLTGAAIDIAKQGFTRKQLKWTRDYLLAVQNEGKVDVAEEFKQRVFHITVYKSYAPQEPEVEAVVETKN
jgi:hypothetical protein